MTAPHSPAGHRVDSPLVARRVVVVGGGVSGLSAAYRLQELAMAAGRPLCVEVCEAAPQPGGLVATREINGYRLELGPDSFITNKPGAVRLCRRLGLEDELIPTDARYRRSLVLFRGRPVAVPEDFQLLAPAALWPVWKSPLFSLRGKLRMALELFVPRTPHPERDESLASFVRRRLGTEALERLVQPLVGGIYTSDPEKLSVRATLARFQEMERESGSLIRALARAATSRDPGHAPATGARYGLFATPRWGVAQLVEVLTAQVEATSLIHRGVGITQLTRTGTGGFRLQTTSGPPLTCEAVILALPAHRAATLLQGECPVAAGELGQIEYASTALVVTGHRLSDVRHPLDAFGLVVPARERRQILAVSFTSRKFPNRAPEGSVQLRTFVGGAMQPELLERSDEELLEIVRRELTELLGIDWRPEVTQIARWNRSMPQYHVGHLERVARIEAAIAQTPNLALAGNSLNGVGLPDTIASGEAAAERIWQGLASVTG